MAKDEKEHSFEVAVTGPGVAIKLPVSPTIANRVIATIMGSTFEATQSDPVARGSDRPAGVGGGAGGQGTRKTAREALNEAQAKRSFDKITAIGAMLMDNGAENFTTEDVRLQFKRASEALPMNFNRDMKSAVKVGWIAPDHDNADAYFVTQAGRDAIAGKFTGDARKSVSHKPKGKRNKKGIE